jgi:hypothetical protein
LDRADLITAAPVMLLMFFEAASTCSNFDIRQLEQNNDLMLSQFQNPQIAW